MNRLPLYPGTPDIMHKRIVSIARLHYITGACPPGLSQAAFVETLCSAGVRWIQFRSKHQSFPAFIRAAAEVKEVCDKYGATLIINDNVEAALAVRAAGVHLGREDMLPSEARKMLGDTAVIGGTVNTPGDVLRLSGEPVDYIGLGPFRFTSTKEKLSPVLGLEGIKELLPCAAIPVIAIGGITSGDVQPLLGAGVHGVAVSSALSLSENPPETVKQFLKTIYPSEPIPV